MRRFSTLLWAVGVLSCCAATACVMEAVMLLLADGNRVEHRFLGSLLPALVGQRNASFNAVAHGDDFKAAVRQAVREELRRPEVVQALLAGDRQPATTASVGPQPDEFDARALRRSNLKREAAEARSMNARKVAHRERLVPKRRHHETQGSEEGPPPSQQPSQHPPQPSTASEMLRTSHESGFRDISLLAKIECDIPFDAAGGSVPTDPRAARLPALSTELLHKAAHRGVVVATFSNTRMLDMMFNWALHLRLAGLQGGPLVGLMKDVEGAEVGRVMSHVLGYAAEKDTNLSQDNNAQGGRWILAWELMRVALQAGLSLLLSDSDVVWLKNPVPYILAVQQKEPSLDFLISSDAPISSALAFSQSNWVEVEGAQELGLEDSLSNHAPFNIGIMWLACKPAAGALLQRFVDVVATIHEVDQWPINLMLREGMMERVTAGGSRAWTQRSIYPAANGTFNMGVLNVAQFCSSLVYSVTQAYRTLGLTPFGVHLTYVQDQAIDAKRMRAREEMLFADPPSYYTRDHLLAFTVPIPSEMAKTKETHRGQPPYHHFALLRLQLAHLQAALFIGHVLRRRVVLPRFICTCQNEGYTPHENCRGPGHPTKLPYLCPTDHWGRPEELMALNTAPPGLLEHPCMPASFRETIVHVKVCGDGGQPCPVVPSDNTAFLRPKSTDESILAKLERYSDANVLSFDNIADAFGGFLDVEKEGVREFVQLANRSLYKFFTYDPPPNGVWYDPMGDVHVVDYMWPSPWQQQVAR